MDLRLKLNVLARPRTFYIGVDLGQRRSYSAIVVLECFEEVPEYTDMLRGAGLRQRYIVRQAERVPLGTPYIEITKRLKRMVERLSRMGTCILVVDG